MGNISNLGLDPLDPAKFEQALDLLSHEQLHCWGAGVRFRNPDGTLNTALFGKDNAHWSYLLDTDGSVLYGNDWKSNKDGSFTSVSASKYYSALDLYLMGMIDKAQVPALTLIENPAIDPMKLPEPGAIITGTTRTVTIDDIIAAEGQRVPDVSDSQKAFKTGFIFITQPGTFGGNEPAGIDTLQRAWAGRFANLTGGKGSIADVTPSLSVNITSPSNNATISRPDVTVRGILVNSTGNETGVTVNGIVATVAGNQYLAEHVPLVEGSNTITVMATDTAGYTATSSVTVNIVTDRYITLKSNITSGTGPLDVTLRIDGSFSITNSDVSYTGPGTVEFLPGTAVDEYKVRMTIEGTYTFTAQVTDDQNNTYTDTAIIVVQNRAALDTLLKAKWVGMKGALTAGDIETTIGCFSTGVQESFRINFTALAQYLSAIVAGMGDVQLVNVTDRIAECSMESVRDGVPYSFQVLFVLEQNGKWGIWSF